MKVKEQLLSKNGMATIKLSKELLKYSIGDKIPTVTEFSDALDLVRGTVQNALKNLTDAEAIRIESKGHLGSYLIKKNTTLLLNFAGIDSLVGVMPLPYSKRYEGFASGLIATMENRYDLPVNLAYMRGAKNRMAMLIQGRYDFAVVSKFAALEFVKDNMGVEIVMEFGKNSYLSDHVVMFHDNDAKEISDGMKVGLDLSSVDQRLLCEKACEGKDVEFVELEYSSLINRIIEGDIDAAVMNIDEVLDKKLDINCQPLETDNYDNTEAVIIISDKEEELAYVIRDLIDVETVINVQNLVLEDKITPSY